MCLQYGRCCALRQTFSALRRGEMAGWALRDATFIVLLGSRVWAESPHYCGSLLHTRAARLSSDAILLLTSVFFVGIVSVRIVRRFIPIGETNRSSQCASSVRRSLGGRKAADSVGVRNVRKPAAGGVQRASDAERPGGRGRLNDGRYVRRDGCFAG